MKPQSPSNAKVSPEQANSPRASARATGANGLGGNRFGVTGFGISRGHLPMEWMDPMSWRLPSGKALAEFALQAGFLAPLILSGPRGGVRGAAIADTSTGGTAGTDGSSVARSADARGVTTGFGKARESAR